MTPCDFEVVLVFVSAAFILNLIKVVGRFFSIRFSSFPSLALFIFPLFFFGQLCVYTAITQFAFLSVGFSHDRSNSFEHFEA